LKEGQLDKETLAQYAFEEGYKTEWLQAGILHFKPNHTYRKYKETAHMFHSDNPISQPSLEISPAWFPVIRKVFK
jgi:hypothetical protein